MEIIEQVQEVVGKTIKEATIVKDPVTGDQELVLRFSDGSLFKVQGFQSEGYPMEISISEAT